MNLKCIDNVGIFNVVLNKILDSSRSSQVVVGPETELDDIGIYEEDQLEKLALELTDAIPLFTDIMPNSYRSWKTVFDVYKTVERLDREGQDNMSVNHSHRKGKQ